MPKVKEENNQLTGNKKTKQSGVLSCGNLIKVTKEPKLRKYLEITMNRFEAKCSFLINQIQEMKVDFVSQLEGINALFSLKQKTIDPISRNHYSAKLIEGKISNYNERHYHYQKQINQQYLNTAPSSSVANKEEKRKTVNIAPIYQKDSDQKLSIQIIKTNEESMKLKIDFKDQNKINVNKTKIKDEVSDKIRALMLICNSEYFFILSNISLLCFKEKVIIKKLNRQLHKDKPLKEVWMTSKNFLEKRIRKIEATKSFDLPSNTCQSSLNFIKKENENDLKDMSNQYNKAFFSLIYILFGERIPSNISYEHLYESILRKNQTHSISILSI